jgi:WD40 repeat protein
VRQCNSIQFSKLISISHLSNIVNKRNFAVLAWALHTFQGQGDDVNTVQFLPDGHHFGTGSDDGVCHFFDTHMGHELQHYIDSMPPQGAIPMLPLLLSPIQDVSCLRAIPMPTATSGTPSG